MHICRNDGTSNCQPERSVSQQTSTTFAHSPGFSFLPTPGWSCDQTADRAGQSRLLLCRWAHRGSVAPCLACRPGVGPASPVDTQAYTSLDGSTCTCTLVCVCRHTSTHITGCVYLYLYTCVCVDTQAHITGCVYLYLYTCVCVSTHKHTHHWMGLLVPVHLCVCRHTSIHITGWVYLYLYTCVCVSTHKHTHHWMGLLIPVHLCVCLCVRACVRACDSLWWSHSLALMCALILIF